MSSPNSEVHLNRRSCIHFPCANEIVQHAEKHRAPKHEAAIIHCRSCWMVHRWPQAEEKDDDKVYNRGAVRNYTENTRYTPWAPRKFLARKVGERLCCGRVDFDVAA